MVTPRDPRCEKVNAGELARLIGVNRRMVYKWMDKGMPREGRLYDVATCVQWVIAAQSDKGNDEPQDVIEARRRLLVAQTAKTELETRRISGELVELAEAKHVLNQIAAIVAGQLDAIAPRLAAELAGITDQKVIEERLFDEHRNVRASIADAVMELSPRSGGHNGAAAEADGGRVGGRQSRPSDRSAGAGTVADEPDPVLSADNAAGIG